MTVVTRLLAQSTWLLRGVLLGALLGACGAPGMEGNFVCDERSCQCMDVPNCALDCPMSPCDIDCASADSCDATCDDGCTYDCTGASSCDVACDEDCRVDCRGVSRCDASCGARCEYLCESASSCTATVGPESTVTCSMFGSCTVSCVGSCTVHCAQGGCAITCAGGAEPEDIGDGSWSCPPA